MRHDLVSRRGAARQLGGAAASHSESLVNLLKPDAPVAHTLHVPSGTVGPIWEVAARFRAGAKAA